MATLTETAFYFRRIIKFTVIFVFVFVFGKIILDFGLNLWKKLHPPPPPPPTVSFGQLPAIKFPKETANRPQEFQLQTPTGTFPQSKDRAKVYFMPSVKPNLLALDKAKELAKRLGFENEPIRINDKVFEWKKNNIGQTVLKMDIFSGSFNLSFDWKNDPSLLLEKNLPGKEQAKIEADNFLQRAGLKEKDLAKGKMKVSFLKVSGKKLFPALSVSEANFVQVEIFRQDYDELPVITLNPKKGIISLIFSGSTTEEKKLVKAEFNYFPVKTDSWGTYPLKTPAAAWEELKSGGGYIASFNNKENTVIIRRIYFAYLDTYEPQQFLQPVIVFQGDNDFFAIVPAITDEWLK